MVDLKIIFVLFYQNGLIAAMNGRLPKCDIRLYPDELSDDRALVGARVLQGLWAKVGVTDLEVFDYGPGAQLFVRGSLVNTNVLEIGPKHYKDFESFEYDVVIKAIKLETVSSDWLDVFNYERPKLI
jgi:hypothetical protein